MKLRSVRLGLLFAAAGFVADAAAAAPSAVAQPSIVVDAAAPKAPAGEVKAAAAAAGAAAIAAAMLAFFNRRRLAKAAAAAGQAAAQLGRAVVAAPGRAFRATGRALGAPIRNVLLAFLTIVFVLTGVDLLNIEWTAGLVVGALLAALATLGLRELRATARFMVNGN